MKKLFMIIIAAFLMHVATYGQEINFRSLKENTRHILSAHIGADYGTYYGLSYGYVLTFKGRPVVIGTEARMSFGDSVQDDWKWKTGFQAEVWRHKNWSVAAKPTFILRRYESTLAKMYNVGADITMTFGYLKEKWGVVGMANYDAALATRITNEKLREYYPGIKDGWYGSSGGTFKFGLKANVKIQSFNLFVAAGKQYGQNFHDNPTLPFFAELTLTSHIGKRIH